MHAQARLPRYRLPSGVHNDHQQASDKATYSGQQHEHSAFSHDTVMMLCSHAHSHCLTTLVLPSTPLLGTLFIFWASHWLLGYVRHYYEGQKRGEQFRSKTCYRFLWFPEAWPMEAVVKAAFPLVAILLELWLAHPGGYR